MGSFNFNDIATQFYAAGTKYSSAIQPYAIKLFVALLLLDILVACNVEIESNICYQSVCLEQRSDCRGPKLRNCRHERARGCCAPVTCAVRG